MYGSKMSPKMGLTGMYYLLSRGGRFYYNRRVPNAFRAYDPRDKIRVALNTDSRKEALKLALAHNERLEGYWQGLAATGATFAESDYKALVDRSRLLGFTYLPCHVLASGPVTRIVNRLAHAETNAYHEKHVEAVLGKHSEPVITISGTLNRFWDLVKDQTLNKSPNQIRKWRNPRVKAIHNLIGCIGDKPLHEITRDDMLNFRNWWIGRLDKEGLISGSANKDLIYCKMILTTVAENMKVTIDTGHLFRKLIITKDDSVQRLPFESSYIVSTLLNPDNLKGLNEQARWVLHAFAETGAGLAELTGLMPEDIRLDAEIPHVAIVPRTKKALKTKFRARQIPLVGFALDAFKACPKGFTDYYDRPDALSAVLGKYLRENNLLPTDQHSVYSLRHSFQDRILSVNCPDRIQADVMGHKFNRPVYGAGATLAHKLEWMQKVQLKQG